MGSYRRETLQLHQNKTNIGRGLQEIWNGLVRRENWKLQEDLLRVLGNLLAIVAGW